MTRETRSIRSFLSCNINTFPARAQLFLSQVIGHTSNISVILSNDKTIRLQETSVPNIALVSVCT